MINQSPSPSYLAPNHQVMFSSSSSSSASFHILFNSTHEDHAGYNYHSQLYQPPHYQDHQDGNHGAGSSYEIKNKVNNGLKLTLWKKEDQTNLPAATTQKINYDPAVKYMGMGLMKKMKKNDPKVPEKVETAAASSLESTDIISSNSCSYNSSSPIRVCADCNTTKTPLWRSGPKGPKSLCNACGIRQRKARRAMAAAAASGGMADSGFDQPPAVKIKVQHKDKIGKNKHSSQLKKRYKMAAGSSTCTSTGGQKKLSFEDFLINLNNKYLSFQRVFPQDEKDAAILLMALSSGLVHG